jgi:glycosyltransferase involved in cell wall biosynthesis
VSGQSTRLAARRSDGYLLRILYVVDALSYNGAVVMATGVASRLRELGAPAELFALLPVDRGRVVPVDPAVAVTQGKRGPARMRWALPLVVARLVQACRRAEVVVAVSEVGPALLLSYVGARLARRPYAVMIHADLARAVEQWVHPRLRQPTYAVHRRADAAICVAHDFVAAAVANGLDPSRVHVVPGGIDVQRVRALAAEPEEIEPATVPRVVGLGRLSVEKGFDLLVCAHARVLESGPPHELVLIGEGPEQAELSRLASDLGVSSSVRLAGMVRNPFPTLAAASVFVLPSRREGRPLALLEALALGLPVIASQCGRDVEDALGNGELGELVAPDSVDDLAAALRSHLEAPERLRTRARAAAQHAERYDLDGTARRLVDVLGPVARPPERKAPATPREATED